MASSQAAAAGATSGAEVHKDIIICDNGTGYLKAGFGGENIPQYVYPSLVGRPMMRAEEDVLDGVELKVCTRRSVTDSRKCIWLPGFYPAANTPDLHTTIPAFLSTSALVHTAVSHIIHVL